MSGPLEFHLRELLANNTGIQSRVADRITALVRDEDGAFPAIVYQSSKPVREKDLDGELSDIGTLVVAYEVWAKTYSSAALIAADIIAELENFSGDFPGYQVSNIDVEKTDEDGDDENRLYVIDLVATVVFKYQVQ